MASPISLSPVPSDAGHRHPGRADGALAAIDEMLDRLETVTHAGRQHLMTKIVSVLTSHPVIASGGPFIAERVEDLRREAGKAAPDGYAFARATRALFSATRRLLGSEP
jgi:hypothetical protein